jgi:DNA replication protein DnaD
MKPFEKFLSHSSTLREILDFYLELRQHLQEVGIGENELETPPIYTTTMMTLHMDINNLINSLVRQVNDYGFDVTREEIQDYINPLFLKINEITPLKNGNSKRNNPRDEDY